MKIPLDQQILAVETEYVNLMGTIEILKDLVAKNKREEVELRIKEARALNLSAGLETLKWLQANENRIKQALRNPLPASRG